MAMTENSFWRRGYAFLIVGLMLSFAAFSFFGKGFSKLAYNWSVASWKLGKGKIQSVKAIPVYARNQTHLGYRLIASYTYKFNNVDYVGEKVAPDPTFGFSASEISNKKSMLEKAASEGAVVDVLVNPEKNQEAYILRNEPLSGYMNILTAILFLSAGGALCIYFIFRNGAEDERESLKKDFPKQPWRWETEWRSFQIAEGTIWERLMPISVLCGIIGIMTVSVFALLFKTPKVLPHYWFMAGSLLTFWVYSITVLLAKKRGITVAKDIELIAGSYPLIPGKNWQGKIVLRNSESRQNVSAAKVVFAKRKNYASAIVETEDDGEIQGREFQNYGGLNWGEAVNPNEIFKLPVDFSVKDKGEFSELLLDFVVPEKWPNTDLEADDYLYRTKWEILFVQELGNSKIKEIFHVPVFSEDIFSEPQINAKFDRN
jgi:hypothetical protein